MKKYITKINKCCYQLCDFKSLTHLNLHPICRHWCIAHKLHHFYFYFYFSNFFAFLFPFCESSITNHSSPHAFNSINDTLRKKNPIIYSWDLKKNNDSIFSSCFQDFFNIFY